MKQVGTISYNIYCNFTNYGSALQTWALHQAVKKIGHYPILIDYCPDVLSDKNPLDPFSNMWDQDEESLRMCELSMPAIRINYEKFDNFYRDRFDRTAQKYTSGNFEEIVKEGLDGFICGSDTIFCIEEFKGFDDGYYANYNVMKNRTVSYAASFGDACFDKHSLNILKNRLENFLALGLRETFMIDYVAENVNVPVARTLDPTLLLAPEDYDTIATQRQIDQPYLLLYARRYNLEMEAFAERIARKNDLRIVEISLRATNAQKGHIMRYEAGVEEFLSLVKHASFVVTNSFHGLIFAFQYQRPVKVFTREQAHGKINELLEFLDLREVRYMSDQEEDIKVSYDHALNLLKRERNKSFDFLKQELELI